jgi:hypothetical protein
LEHRVGYYIGPHRWSRQPFDVAHGCERAGFPPLPHRSPVAVTSPYPFLCHGTAFLQCAAAAAYASRTAPTGRRTGTRHAHLSRLFSLSPLKRRKFSSLFYSISGAGFLRSRPTAHENCCPTRRAGAGARSAWGIRRSVRGPLGFRPPAHPTRRWTAGTNSNRRHRRLRGWPRPRRRRTPRLAPRRT